MTEGKSTFAWYQDNKFCQGEFLLSLEVSNLRHRIKGKHNILGVVLNSKN